MSNKIDLEVSKGSVYNNSNTYSLKYNIKNNDSTSLSLSAVRVVSYAWLQDRYDSLHFTSGVNFIGEIRTFNETPLSGVSTQNGIEELFLGQNSYLINHDTIDSSKVAPQITLIVPNGGSEIGPISISNRTNNSFTIVLPDTPTTSGYFVSWLIPNHFTEYTNIETMQGSLSASFERLSVPYIREDNKLATHKIVLNHITSASINPGQGLFDVDTFISYYKTFFNNSNLDSWYTELTTQFSSNKSIVLEKYNGSVWIPLLEYTQDGIDVNTGKEPVSKNTLIVSPTILTSADKAVYICSDNLNPINNSLSDRDHLVIKSNNGSGIKRSLISFDVSAIPSSAETIINSYIRLNVNTSTSAFDYTLSDGTISVHRILNSWKEDEVSWIKRDNSNDWSTVGGDFSDAISTWKANESINGTILSGTNNDYYIDLDVTQALQYWKDNPTENHGLLLKLTPSSNENSSNTIEFNINSFRNSSLDTNPTLLISYDDQTSVVIPSGEITHPANNGILSSPYFNVSAIASVSQGSVFNVTLQYKDINETIYQDIGGLIRTGEVWGNTFSPLSSGDYNLRLKMMSNDGIYGYSNPISISYLTSADIIIINTSAVGNDNVVINGYVTSITPPVSGYIEYQYDYIPTSATIHKIVNDVYSSNVVWISTNNGIYRIDKTNLSNPVTRFGLDVGLVDSFSTAFYIDSLGYVWAGTNEGIDSKLYRFNSLYWNSLDNLDIRIFTRFNSTLSNLNSSIELYQIIEENNKLYFTSKNTSKIFIADDRELSSFNIVTLQNIPKAISKNNGNVYFGSYSSGLELITSSNSLSSISNSISNINSIKFDSLNNAWVSNSTKVYCITSAGTVQDISAINDYNLGEVSNISVSGSTKIFFFKNKGILTYTGIDFTSATATNISNWASYNIENSLIESNNISHGEYSNSYWIATDKGLSNFNTSSVGYSKNNANIKADLNLLGNNFNVNWPASDSGTLKLRAQVFYENGETIYKNFDFLVVSTPIITVNINQDHFINYAPSTLVSAFSVNISNVVGGYTTKIYTAKTLNGVYTEKVSSANSPYVVYSDIFNIKETIYIKSTVTDTYGNLVTSESYKVIIGDSSLIYNIGTSSIDYATYSPLLISGTVSGDREITNIYVYVSNIDDEYFVGAIGPLPNSNFSLIWPPELVDGIDSIRLQANYIDGDFDNYITSIPRITSGPEIVLEPSNKFYSNNTVGTISATVTHISGVSAAMAYVDSLIIPLILSSGKWVGSFDTSSISTSAGGTYNIIVSATSNGNYKSSSNTSFSVNSLPTYTNTNLSYITSNPLVLSGIVNDYEGYIETRVDVLSSDINWNNLGYITSSISDMTGNVTHQIGSIPPGQKYFLIKTYDRNPNASADYSLTNLSIYTNAISSSLILSGANTISINNETVYSVLSDKDVLLSANISSQTSVSAMFWEIEFSGNEYIKKNLIAIDDTVAYTALTKIQSSRVLNGGQSSYVIRGVLLEILDSFGNITTGPIVKIYSSELTGTLEVTNGSLCSVSATYSGTIINSNFPRFGSPLIGSSLSASILNSSNVKIIDVPYYRGVSEEFFYNVNLPLSSVSGNTDLRLRLQDSNGLATTTILNTGLINGSSLSADIVLSGNILYTSGDLYIVSGAFNISGSASAGVKTFKVISTSDIGQDIYFANDSLIANINSDDGKYYTIYADVESNGQCASTTRTLKVISKSQGVAELYPSSCISCYCDSSSLNVYGYIGDTDLEYYYDNSLGNTLSATVTDGVSAIKDLSSAISSLNETNYLSEYSFEWISPRVGTSALYLILSDAYGFTRTIKTELPKTITNGVSATLSTPNDYTLSNEIYPSYNVPFSLNVVSGNVSNVRYYIDDKLIGSSSNGSNNYTFNLNSNLYNGTYTTKAIILDDTGCYTQTSARTIAISDGLIINIIEPDNNSYIGKNISNVFKSAVIDNLGLVSAVNYYYFDNNVSAAKIDTYNANISLSASTEVSAIAFGTNNTSAINTVYVNVVEISSVDLKIDNVTSAIYNSPTQITLDISANINPQSLLSSVIQLKRGLVWNDLLIPTLITSSTFAINTLNHTLLSGVNELRAIVYDQFGNSATSNIVSANNVYTSVTLSNPSIKVISNTPIEKISTTSISTVFEVSDYTNGIFVDSIKLTSASVGTISTIEPIVVGKKYNVTVVVNKTGSVIISASNLINRVTTHRVDNYIIKCATGRELNLTNYLPQNDQYDYYGNDSEFKQFTKFFEDYLNTMYTNTDSSCSLSILEKISKLTSLHDIDTMDQKYIPYLSNMLGYDINFDKNSIGEFGGKSLGLVGNDLESYKDKVLRFVVSNLPNWYSIKTTRNSMKIMLLSFGLIGDVIEMYTLDYDKEWKLNKVEDSLVGEDIGTDWYPTPHMSIGINLNESNMDVINTIGLRDDILTAMDSIRPANVVVDSLLGYGQASLPDTLITLKFQTTKNINVTSASNAN